MNDKTPVDQFEAFTAQLTDTRRELLEAIRKGDSSKWRLITLLLPIVATTILGLVTWGIQTKIQTSISDQGATQANQLREQHAATQNQLREQYALTQNQLREQLALTQYYYRERLQTYKDVHTQVVALRKVASTATDVADLYHPLETLNSAYSTKSIFVSLKLLDTLVFLWNSGVSVTRRGTILGTDIELVLKAADSSEQQMRADLKVSALDEPTQP